ncbi:hypothetical protein N7492_000269 [Penicillium capsulatum]|uniref:Uncharacterized protein n=1 Tax=Penicillium capsulatum TaxID=69766 RepID=A0A9W9IP74_9EURO|nr:hypothetical protein N7492_000269 [Penicillium capsulatum]KAJ6130665.1 hypothetical protein N7512_003445 [Penicillium capsulatum]
MARREYLAQENMQRVLRPLEGDWLVAACIGVKVLGVQYDDNETLKLLLSKSVEAQLFIELSHYYGVIVS